MRILMFGRGVIATIYGSLLQEAGHHVEFYVRPGRAAEYGDDVRIDLIDARRWPLGRRNRESFAIRLRESVAAEDGFDLIVLSVAHHRLSEAAAFLAPRLGEASVFVFGNVWEEPLDAIAPLPVDRVVFGFPQAGGGFGDDGVLHGGLLRSVIVGTAGASPTRRERDVQTAFRQAGLTIREERDMRGWLWLHFISDAGMFAQGLRSGSLANMIGDRRALRDAFLTARELLPVLKARGVDFRRHHAAMLPYRLPGLVGAMMAGVTVVLPLAKPSLAAHTDPHAPEPLAVLADTRREARRLNIPTPRLDESAGIASPA
ncbi:MULTISPECIES: ketopantoate reductase family protein [Subtercola]|uniref:Ketopantoate reductase n=1 Tax=Subtercola vilae TaxID=2056433 RepID=A0A4T2CBH7_9MICO|nr:MULTISPECIES: 2-dehydropantoate 2-reductase N-terminal domain-containing protein [Subtercola]MEA9983977.1 2-dehydropantoate 2-reductase N-terminal domain-containing protein [Subtercola sp. RTI3]TIH40952.1 ketopantoate reductase [Subtercola vilae]